MTSLTNNVEHEAHALELNRVSVRYGQRTALEQVSLTLQRGELLALLGQNGAGKSTLARTVTGAVPVREGTVLVCGLSPRQACKRGLVAIVPQRDAISSDAPMTLWELVASGLARKRAPLRPLSTSLRQEMEHELGHLELSGLEHRLIGELSGGQLRRALLARALVQGAPLLILDEPFAGVDTHSAALIRRRLSQQQETATLLITHGTEGLDEIADEVALLRTRIIDRGPVDVITSPASLARLFQTETHA